MNLFEEPVYDETITSAHWHSYSPFLNSFELSDIVRIQIQNQNLNILPSTSLLYIEGNLTKFDGTDVKNARLVNNAAAFMFDEIRYELNGKEIDHNRNVGITSTIKNFISLNSDESLALKNSSWSPDSSFENSSPYFNFCIPLKKLFGFAEDYKNIIPNSKHELILVRSRTDDNAIICTDNTEKPKITITKIYWRVQHINLADNLKLTLYKNIERGAVIKMAFRNWELHEYPSLPSGTDHHIWNVKTTTQLEKPRFIILALQTGKQNKIDADSSMFDHSNISNVKVYLNSNVYPYEDMNLDFDKNRYAIAYEMLTNFKCLYYNTLNAESLVSWNHFKNTTPFFIVDTRFQDETLKMGPVDVKIEIKTLKKIKSNTTAYCLILHDRVVEFTPLTGEVNKLI